MKDCVGVGAEASFKNLPGITPDRTYKQRNKCKYNEFFFHSFLFFSCNDPLQIGVMSPELLLDLYQFHMRCSLRINVNSFHVTVLKYKTASILQL